MKVDVSIDFEGTHTIQVEQRLRMYDEKEVVAALGAGRT